VTEPVALDPVGCGCTECLVGEHLPLDQATAKQLVGLIKGRLRNNTGLPPWEAAKLADKQSTPAPVPSHMCVGPTCWTCGEPTELARMRASVREALFPIVGQVAHEYARIAARAIRADVMALLSERCDHTNSRPI
jgi:hypothetical protein